jgi:hypothetical protein
LDAPFANTTRQRKETRTCTESSEGR